MVVGHLRCRSFILKLLYWRGGVLYPPGSLYKDVLNEELFMKLCPTADDIWFWSMAILNNTKIRVVHNNFSELIYINPEVEFGMKDGITLFNINMHKNDNQLRNVIHFYEERNILKTLLLDAKHSTIS